MKKFSEFVSLGHPDKIADYISQYLLDRYIEKDPNTRYAVEVQIKDNQVTLGGEVSSNCQFSEPELASHVRAAVNEIGYTKAYQEKWGENNTICGDRLLVRPFIGQQSPDIALGLSGWGDQGIFFGLASQATEMARMPFEHTLAKRICKQLFYSGMGGLDIKSQVVTNDGVLEKVIVAIPLINESGKDKVEELVRSLIDTQADYEVIVNGTGRYLRHSSIADCGTTGRKLAVDFYGGSCRIGGGSPWTKDGSKADLSLNLYARQLAIKNAMMYGGGEIFVSLACCIGRQEVDYTVTNEVGKVLDYGTKIVNPAELRKEFKLDTPIYASMCRWGLFGEYQQDKAWEQV